MEPLCVSFAKSLLGASSINVNGQPVMLDRVDYETIVLIVPYSVLQLKTTGNLLTNDPICNSPGA